MRRRHKGGLFVISGPSGVGKTTLCQELTRLLPDLRESISYTTRSPRKGEIDGVHYIFVDRERFREMIKGGEFAEWAVVHGNLYGTSIKNLQEMTEEGYDVILNIDTSGARQIKRRFKDAICIFILPPSIDVLEERLRNRMSEDEEEIRTRLNRAKDEIRSYMDYDYVVINDDLGKAVREVESIIIAHRLRSSTVDRTLIEAMLSRSSSLQSSPHTQENPQD